MQVICLIILILLLPFIAPKIFFGILTFLASFFIVYSIACLNFIGLLMAIGCFFFLILFGAIVDSL